MYRSNSTTSRFPHSVLRRPVRIGPSHLKYGLHLQDVWTCSVTLLLGELKGGFFIEAGSHDAEKNSDSLHFEIRHGWTGLLGNKLFNTLSALEI